jgi:hypothetical protein
VNSLRRQEEFSADFAQCIVSIRTDSKAQSQELSSTAPFCERSPSIRGEPPRFFARDRAMTVYRPQKEASGQNREQNSAFTVPT